MTPIELPRESAPLLAVVRTVLQGDVPDSALVGGLAVTARVSTSPRISYRATADIDFVTTDDVAPTLIEILTARHDTTEPIVIDGIKVDVIPTYDISEADLDGIDDGPRLFVASHRWALDTAEPVTMTCTVDEGPITVAVRLATPDALVAAKCHAVGFARSQRRATKHAADLLDVYRLVDRYHPTGELVPELQRAPGELGTVIAAVVRKEFLINPSGSAAAMGTAAGTPIGSSDVAATMADFADDLEDLQPTALTT